MIRSDNLEGSGEEWRLRFSEATPFPHLVLDDLFRIEPLTEAAHTFPGPDEMAEKSGKPGVLEISDRTRVPPLLAQISDELLGARFTDWLAGVSGIENLITDPAGNWGVLRQSGDGVEGKIHVPPARHPDKPWFRRLTLILHLTPGLNEGHGGRFQLWDRDKTTPQVSLLPLFNRAVVFATSPVAFHSASRTCLAPGQMRRVMQALYFTDSAPG